MQQRGERVGAGTRPVPKPLLSHRENGGVTGPAPGLPGQLTGRCREASAWGLVPSNLSHVALKAWQPQGTVVQENSLE